MRKLTLSIDTSIQEVILGDSPCGVRYDISSSPNERHNCATFRF
jgi:hypothetical protein